MLTGYDFHPVRPFYCINETGMPLIGRGGTFPTLNLNDVHITFYKMAPVTGSLSTYTVIIGTYSCRIGVTNYIPVENYDRDAALIHIFDNRR